MNGRYISSKDEAGKWQIQVIEKLNYHSKNPWAAIKLDNGHYVHPWNFAQIRQVIKR